MKTIVVLTFLLVASTTVNAQNFFDSPKPVQDYNPRSAKLRVGYYYDPFLNNESKRGPGYPYAVTPAEPTGCQDFVHFVEYKPAYQDRNGKLCPAHYNDVYSPLNGTVHNHHEISVMNPVGCGLHFKPDCSPYLQISTSEEECNHISIENCEFPPFEIHSHGILGSAAVPLVGGINGIMSLGAALGL